MVSCVLYSPTLYLTPSSSLERHATYGSLYILHSPTLSLTLSSSL